MFAKIFAIFVLLAVAFAAPEPKAKPEPQVLTYAAGVNYAVPAAAALPAVVSPYGAPLAYSAAVPAGAVFVG